MGEVGDLAFSLDLQTKQKTSLDKKARFSYINLFNLLYKPGCDLIHQRIHVHVAEDKGNSRQAEQSYEENNENRDNKIHHSTFHDHFLSVRSFAVKLWRRSAGNSPSNKG